MITLQEAWTANPLLVVIPFIGTALWIWIALVIDPYDTHGRRLR